MSDIRRSWSTTTPSSEPVTAAEVRAYLRIAHTSEDSTLTNFLIPAARSAIEASSRRCIAPCTLTLKLDRFPAGIDPIKIPRPPLRSITSITYVDGDGDTQTLSSSAYSVDVASEPGLVFLVYGGAWPSTRYIDNAVMVTAAAGWTDSTSMPSGLRIAVMQVVGMLWEKREMLSGSDETVTQAASITNMLDALISPYRVQEFY